MLPRFMRGIRNGEFGAWASKPGIDVRAANEMQLAFSSSFPHMHLIGKGQIATVPCGTNGPENTYDIPYGATFNPVPFVWAIASSTDWTLLLSGGNGKGIRSSGQYQYLNLRWHTYVMETCGGGLTPYGSAGSVRKNGQVGDGLDAAATWASIKFLVDIFPDRIRFRVNNYSSSVLIKYLIMDIN